MDPEDEKLDEEIQEQFTKLPPVVQRAILSAEIEKQLRLLADKHKLHLDQWQSLENEVHLTLLGLQPAEDLAHNIQNDVGLPQGDAAELANEISLAIFTPIREELERELANPQAVETTQTPADTLPDAVLQTSPREPQEERITLQPLQTPVAASPAARSVVPATPPAPAPQGSAVRAPVSENYKSGETSATRKSVHDDPYREAPV